MRWIRWGAASAVCVALAGWANAEPAAGPPPTLDAPITRVLPNGLHIIASADRRAPIVAIDIRYGVGDAMDPLEFPGLAQGIGRVLLDGQSSHLRAGEASRIATAARLAPVDRTVHVTADDTHVTTVVPASGLELGLWLDAERMGFAVGPVVLPQRSEWAMTPLGNLDEIVQRAVFGPNHPYFLEAPEQASRGMTPSFAREWLCEWYTPSNATIAVVGDVDPARASTLVEKYFGGMAGHVVANLPAALPAPSSHEIQVAAPVDSPTLEVAWATPGYLEADNLALDVAARLLEMHLRGRLVDRGHADQVTVGQRSMRLGSVFTVRADLSEERWESRTLDELEDELQKLRSGDFAEAEFILARRLEARDAALTRDSLAGKTRWDSEAFAVVGQLGFSVELFRRYQAIDARTVTAAVSRNLTEARRAIVHVQPDSRIPKGGTVRNEPRRIFRAPRPAPAPRAQDGLPWYHPPGTGTIPAFAVARATEGSTANGVRVLVLKRTELPLVRFRVFAPWSTQLPSLETFRAIPQALAIMLVEGETLEAGLASLGVTSTFAGDVAGLSISVSSTPDAIDGALRLILKALRQPSLQKDASEDLRRRLTLLANPRSMPWNHFGSSTRDMYDVVGQPAWQAPDVPSTTPFIQDDLDRAVRTAWAKDFTISFVGAISLEEASRAVALADRGAPRRARPVPARLSASGGTAQRYDFVEDERSTKGSLVFSCVIPDSVAPQTAVATLPALLNGTFAHLRAGPPNPHGYAPGVFAYNASTHVVRLGDRTLFYLGFAASAEDVGKTVRAVLDRVQSLEKEGEGLTSEEGRGVGRDMLAWLVGGFDSTAEQLERLYELGPDALTFYSAFPFRMDGPDLRSAVQHCFASESLHVVAYGRVRDAAAELKDGGYGPIRVSVAGEGSSK